MPKQYTKEQLWKLYKKLPEELQEVIFSAETAENIWNICEKNNIEAVSSVAKYVGNVLVGVLPPEEFQEVLEKDLKIKKETAKKVAQEINRFIFYPVKPALEELYKIEIAPSAKPAITPPPPAKPPEAAPSEEKPEKPDVYREPTE